MNTIPFSQKEKHDDNEPSDGIQQSIHIYKHEINITEGSEFLDDRIRMKDQPLCETTVKENE